ncbi:adhesion G-protein coupled receptor G7 [Ditylenchus destructor]|uniref:Adhesion G-protein coupled receptor G7 n=1 Tax=Ditylenchus destructor TaxID=166010 RepID=A0AAD4MMX9_9BILA|nr:adhesion G-protein coupled receptor G7 [Ditylenchus destructor]
MYEPYEGAKICMCEGNDSDAEKYCRTMPNTVFIAEMMTKTIYVYGEIETQSRYSTLDYTLKFTLNSTQSPMYNFVCRRPSPDILSINPMPEDKKSKKSSQDQIRPYFFLDARNSIAKFGPWYTKCHVSHVILDTDIVNGLYITFAKDPLDKNSDVRMVYDLDLEPPLEVFEFFVDDLDSKYEPGECRIVRASPFNRYCYCMGKNRTANFCGTEKSRISMFESIDRWQGKSEAPQVSFPPMVTKTYRPISHTVQITTAKQPSVLIESNEDLEGTLYGLESLLESEDVSAEDINNALVAFDKILDVESDNFTQDTSFRFLTVLNKLIDLARDDFAYTSGKNLALVKSSVSCGSDRWPHLSFNGQNFIISRTPNIGMNKQNSIGFIDEEICKVGRANHSYIAIFYIMRNRKLFHTKKNIETNSDPREFSCERQILFPDPEDGVVLSGKLVPNDNGSGIDEIHQIEYDGSYVPMIQLKFSLDNIDKPLHSSFVVTHWTGQRWVAEIGQEMREKGDYLVAEINHLTDFTLLVDGLKTDPILCNEFLKDFSTVLNVLSTTGLVLLAFAIIGRRSKVGLKKRFSSRFSDRSQRSTTTKSSATRSTASVISNRSAMNHTSAKQNEDELIRLLYYIFLALFYLSFTLLSDDSQIILQLHWLTCTTAAKITYFFLLSCVTITLFQSLEVVALFSHSTKSEHFLKHFTQSYWALIACTVVPGVILCIIHRLSPKLFDRRDSFCWLRPDYVVPAVVLPLTGVLFQGVICFVLIIFKILEPSNKSRTSMSGLSIFRRASARRLTATLKRTEKADKVLVLFCIQIMLGLPWVFQYLAMSSPELVLAHYAFTIVIGSQGIVLFVLFCYRRVRLRNKEKSFIDLTASIRDTMSIMSFKRNMFLSSNQ